MSGVCSDTSNSRTSARQRYNKKLTIKRDSTTLEGVSNVLWLKITQQCYNKKWEVIDMSKNRVLGSTI
eukprot:11661288-Ditylum_brightwellii.AAC.1